MVWRTPYLRRYTHYTQAQGIMGIMGITLLHRGVAFRDTPAKSASLLYEVVKHDPIGDSAIHRAHLSALPRSAQYSPFLVR